MRKMHNTNLPCARTYLPFLIDHRQASRNAEYIVGLSFMRYTWGKCSLEIASNSPHTKARVRRTEILRGLVSPRKRGACSLKWNFDTNARYQCKIWLEMLLTSYYRVVVRGEVLGGAGSQLSDLKGRNCPLHIQPSIRGEEKVLVTDEAIILQLQTLYSVLSPR